MEDYIVECVATELLRSKSKEYKQQVIVIKSSLYSFLYQNNLLIKNPFHEDGTIKEDFVLMRSDLTEAGFMLYKKPVQNWYKARGNDGNFSNIEILKKGLQKIIDNKSN